MATCLFCKIAQKEMPARALYQDSISFAFEDIHPKAPTHVLIIPKRHIESLEFLQEEDTAVIGHLFVVARNLARQRGLHKSGYRTVINTGPDAGQSVFHVHVHLLGGRIMAWPPG